MDTAKSIWDRAFDDVNKSTLSGFDVPQDVAEIIAARAGPSIKIPQGGVPITGREMMDFQQAVNQLASETPGGVLEKSAKSRLRKLAKSVDSTVASQLGGKLNDTGEDIGENFLKNKDRWKTWQAIKGVSDKSFANEFTFRQAALSAGKKGARELQDLATESGRVLKPFPSRQGIFQTAAAVGLLGGGGLTGWNAAGEDASFGEKLRNAGIGAAIAYGGAKGVASPKVQKLLADYSKARTPAEAERIAKLIMALRQSGGITRRAAAIASSPEGDE
jgi:hypothetical protein